MTPDIKVTEEIVDQAAEVIAQDTFEGPKTLEFLKQFENTKLELLQLLMKRPNISWADQVLIEATIHELRIAEKGKNPGGRPINGVKVGWSAADTARELNRAIGTFSEDLKLANALKSNPSLAKVKDKTTALKLIKRQVQRDLTEIESLLPADNMNQVLLGDSLEILKNFADKTFDACITDPPWTEYKDPNLCADQNTLPVFKEIFRVLKPNAFLVCVLSTPDFISYSKVLPTMGFKVQDYPMIWKKEKGMTHGATSWQTARDFEPILLAVKGSPVLTSGTEVSSLFTYPIVHYTRMIHPNEKPIELAESLIRNFTFAGGKVIDPFAGSGVFIHAAKKLDRKYVGVERNIKFFKNIEKRLS